MSGKRTKKLRKELREIVEGGKISNNLWRRYKRSYIRG